MLIISKRSVSALTIMSMRDESSCSASPPPPAVCLTVAPIKLLRRFPEGAATSCAVAFSAVAFGAVVFGAVSFGAVAFGAVAGESATPHEGGCMRPI